MNKYASRWFPIFLLAVFLISNGTVIGQEEVKEEIEFEYEFTIDNELAHTPVKNQYRTGTCWCFATISFLESEILRNGKEEIDLSEMFVVRNTYPKKALNYVQLHADANFSQGGQSHDVINQIRDFGVVTEDVYSGMHIEESRHNHGEMVSVLSSIVDGVLQRRGSRVTPRWREAFDAVLDVYLGSVPEKFDYKGKDYTPKDFADDYLELELEDYIELTSFSHHPFYQQCRLEIPDNWDFNNDYYNVPIDDLEKIIDNALEDGYTICWDGDVSEEEFSSRKKGYAIIPVKDFYEKSDEEKEAKITEPVEEKEVSQEIRQKTFDNFTTTDDHLMHIVGVARDQEGNKFYYTKNSGGTVDRENDGYVYMSRAYTFIKVIAIMVHKDAIPKDIKKKLAID